MGLDMFLHRKVYINSKYKFNNIEGEVNLTKGGKYIPINSKNIVHICEEVGYWRKANQIHNWFVENVQYGEDDCEFHEVSIEQLEKLLNICKVVYESCNLVETKVNLGDTELIKKVIEDNNVAKTLLPSCEGSFFGSTEYDEDYLADVKYTIELIEEILKREKELNEIGIYSDYEYISSW